jgi:hypothetical protein
MLVASVFLSFAGYNFISAANWTAPTGAPPTNNVDVPLNAGATTQSKTGILNLAGVTTDDLAAFGNVGVTSAAPQIEFDDTSGDNNAWWLHSNAYGSGPRIHFLYDRNNNGSWDSGDGSVSMFVQAGAATDGSGDELFTPGKVATRQYCDENGQNCFKATDIALKSCDISLTATISNESTKTISVSRPVGTSIYLGASVWLGTENYQNYGFTGGPIVQYSHSVSAFDSYGHSSQAGWWNPTDYSANLSYINSTQNNGSYNTSIKTLTVTEGASMQAQTTSAESPGEVVTMAAHVGTCQ